MASLTPALLRSRPLHPLQHRRRARCSAPARLPHHCAQLRVSTSLHRGDMIASSLPSAHPTPTLSPSQPASAAPPHFTATGTRLLLSPLRFFFYFNLHRRERHTHTNNAEGVGTGARAVCARAASIRISSIFFSTRPQRARPHCSAQRKRRRDNHASTPHHEMEEVGGRRHFGFR